jgi:phage gp36-like protein
MANYATKEDIDDLYGSDLLIKIADQDRDGVPDPAVVQRGLDSAQGLIDGALEGKYTLPLNGTSNLLRELAIDIAVYKICLVRSVRTNEMRQRYDDAMSILDKIAAGKQGIALTPPSDGSGTGTGTAPGSAPTMVGRSINTFRS